MSTSTPSKSPLHEANNTPVLGNYVVAIEGRPNAYFPSAEKATLYFVRSSGRARIYDPAGRILITRGRIMRD